jgi:DNA-binding NarL/FixJ family response regulator
VGEAAADPDRARIVQRHGADGFAERAPHQLLATGETVRKRSDDPRDELAPEEEHIARLALAGRTKAEIGTELFISRAPSSGT